MEAVTITEGLLFANYYMLQFYLLGGQTTTNFASSANEREETEIKEDGDELRVEEKKDGGTEEKHGR